jgi:hypothetical protein
VSPVSPTITLAARTLCVSIQGGGSIENHHRSMRVLRFTNSLSLDIDIPPPLIGQRPWFLAIAMTWAPAVLSVRTMT